MKLPPKIRWNIISRVIIDSYGDCIGRIRIHSPLIGTTRLRWNQQQNLLPRTHGSYAEALRRSLHAAVFTKQPRYEIRPDLWSLSGPIRQSRLRQGNGQSKFNNLPEHLKREGQGCPRGRHDT